MHILRRMTETCPTQRGFKWLCTEPSASVFKIKLNFFGYFDPEKVFLTMKINNFQRDVIDISATQEPLTVSGTLCVILVV